MGAVRAASDPPRSDSARATPPAPLPAPARSRRAVGPVSCPGYSARARSDRTEQRLPPRRISKSLAPAESSPHSQRGSSEPQLHARSMCSRPRSLSVHISGNPRSSASRVAGVRSSRAIVFSRFCSIHFPFETSVYLFRRSFGSLALLVPALKRNNGLRTFGSQAAAGGLLKLD